MTPTLFCFYSNFDNFGSCNNKIRTLWVHTNLFQLVLCTDHNHRGNLKRFRGFIVKPKLLRAGFRIWYINPARLLCIHKSRIHNDTKTFFKSNYRTCAIITRSWFKTALDYNPRILNPKIQQKFIKTH